MLPELRHAVVPQAPLLRMANAPRTSLNCRGRQEGITNVREMEQNQPEQGRRSVDTSSEQLRAAGETKEKGSRNTCEQTPQL